MHHRRVQWADRSCLVEDRVEGYATHDVESRLHFHPDVKVVRDNGCLKIYDKEQHLASVSLLGEGRIVKTQGWYCPEFGIREPCLVIFAEFRNVSLPFRTGWLLQFDK